MHNAEFRGSSGPVKTTVPMIPVEINKAFLEAAQKHGFSLLDDPYGGNVSTLPFCSMGCLCSLRTVRRRQVTGCFEGAATLDRQAKWTRSYAATAYYVPHGDNPRLTVGALAVNRAASVNEHM